MRRALDLFFQHIHHTPSYCILHQASVMERYRTGLLDAPLALSLVGLTSSLLDLGPGTKELGNKYIDLAESMVLNERERPSMPLIQALIFIIKHRSAARRFSGVFTLMAIAVRFAMALRLNYEAPRMSFLAREGCRRVMWSLYMIDTILASGYQDFTLCPDEIIHVSLPCHDRNFRLDLPQAVDTLRARPSNGGHELSSMALTILALGLRYRVLRFTKRAAISSNTDLESEIRPQEEDIETYIGQLPPSFTFSESNVRLHAYSSTLPALATIHIALYVSQCNIYRLTIAGLQEAMRPDILNLVDPKFITQCHYRCLESTRGMARLFKALLELDLDRPILDFEAAATAYQCARMQYYLHRIIPGISTDELSACSQHCLDFIDKLCFDGDAVDYIVSPTRYRPLHHNFEVSLLTKKRNPAERYEAPDGARLLAAGFTRTAGQRRGARSHGRLTGWDHRLASHPLEAQPYRPDEPAYRERELVITPRVLQHPVSHAGNSSGNSTRRRKPRRRRRPR